MRHHPNVAIDTLCEYVFCLSIEFFIFFCRQDLNIPLTSSSASVSKVPPPTSPNNSSFDYPHRLSANCSCIRHILLPLQYSSSAKALQVFFVYCRLVDILFAFQHRQFPFMHIFYSCLGMNILCISQQDKSHIPIFPDLLWCRDRSALPYTGTL